MPPRKRHRGGQPGNRNALKNGFYSRHFRDLDLDDLDQLQAGIDSEIAMLRVHLREFQESTQSDPFAEIDLDKAIARLNTLDFNATRIASMMRIQQSLAGVHDPARLAVSEALKQIHKEFKLEL